MDFIQKNNFVISHSSEAHFERDKDLLLKLNPHTRLGNELSRANRFNKKTLDSRILLALLDIATPDEILANRADKPLDAAQKSAEELAADEAAKLAAEEAAKLAAEEAAAAKKAGKAGNKKKVPGE
jgi:hypothetical protein